MPTLRPLQQGMLDGLCGLYAVINAVRLLAARQSRRLNTRALFLDLLDHTDRAAGIYGPLTEGIETKAFAKIARAAAKTLAADYRLPLSVQRPFALRKRMTIEELHAAIARGIAVDGAVFILATTGRFDHWTVVHGVSPSAFLTFDSAGGKRIDVGDCSIPGASTSRGRTPYEVAVADIFRMTPNPVPRRSASD